ncbi:endolysin [Corynebacterium phage Juicebox]|uniref:Lysin A n=1 Tax=Corynebacterium phage Juicebox TaxID=2301600 RepID=A0A385UCI0_9CAUD|nr:endolysin [Corynebacterium phage Juicebox]AYB69452.1 lysin A [Corynebacterium phage Juicebox]
MADYFYPLSQGAHVTSPFGPRAGGYHWGTDYGRAGGSGGNAVYAPQAGTVIMAGPASGFGGPDPAGWIVIDHPTAAGGGVSVLGHIIREVAVGDTVRAGQRIGRVNPSSATNGGVAPHVHFEHHRYVWSPPGPDRLDPHAWLATRGARWPGAPATPTRKESMNALTADIDLLTPNDDGRATKPRNLLCIHTFEDDGTWSADRMAKYQQSPAAGGSYHLVIDLNGRIARENDDAFIPWAAMFTGNRVAFHFSLSGKASWTRQQWLARPKQMDALAKVLAAYSKAKGIPLIRRGPQDVRAGKWGVCGHDDISKAFGESTHWDPGPNFPFDVVIDKAKAILAEPKPTPAPPSDPAPRPIPPKETLVPTTLDTVLPSLVDGSTFEAPLATFIRTADKQAYEANQRIARLEAKFDRLLDAMGEKPDPKPGQ